MTYPIAGGQMHKILVADKNPLVLKGLESLFDNEDALQCIGAEKTGPGFLDRALRCDFDIGITGWEMTGIDGRGILDALSSIPNAPKIIIYTGVPNRRVIREAMLHGAYGFCAKGDSTEQLLMTIKSVAAGQMVFPRIDLRDLQNDPWESLTRRELDLLDFLRTGQTNQEIANCLGISVNTVKFHLKNLFEKLQVKNRAQAIALAVSRFDHH